MESIPHQVLAANKFEAFNPMQEKCLTHIATSLVVAAPTASGKTIVAELFALNAAMKENKKVIYTCPLRALASEHYLDFKKKYPALQFALATGDLDSSSSYLKKFDVIFTTYEKLASLLRHKAEWLASVGCIIVDELHELDSDRGPVLEIALTQLRNSNKNLRVLGLSATIPNAEELSQWLNATLVTSDYRPTKLREGILFDEEITFNTGQSEPAADTESFIEKVLADKKQALVFLSSRKRAEGFAKKISSLTKAALDGKDTAALLKESKKALNVLESPTEQCASLAQCIAGGVAFHHAGLLTDQRALVEDNFRAGHIKVLCSTTTLAAGVNTPADVVLIPSLYRFEEFGMELISVREYKQMAGRSGRPKFSTEGKSVVVASTSTQQELFTEKFINGTPEKVESQLAIVPILRTHVLALIATQDIYNLKSTEQFFEKTLFARQFGDMGKLLDTVMGIVEDLKKYNFVQEKGEYLTTTPLGKRVSDLFLDPETAHELVNALKVKKTFSPIAYLYAWANCFEFAPWINAPKNMGPIIFEELQNRIDELPFNQESVLYGNDSLNKFFSAMLLEQWIKEKKESDLFETYGLAPGVLFGKTRIIEWLAYSTEELAKVLNEPRHQLPAHKLGLRVKHGVKEELLLLVELRGIGRVRARRLFDAGIKKPSDIATHLTQVEALFGKTLAVSLKKQVVGKNSTIAKTTQQSLLSP